MVTTVNTQEVETENRRGYIFQIGWSGKDFSGKVRSKGWLDQWGRDCSRSVSNSSCKGTGLWKCLKNWKKVTIVGGNKWEETNSK